jgi:hypothetical protein
MLQFPVSGGISGVVRCASRRPSVLLRPFAVRPIYAPWFHIGSRLNWRSARGLCFMKPRHPLRQDLGRPSGRRAAGRHLPLYIDRHLVHEVTSRRPSRACAYRRKVRAPDKTLAVVDHNVPTPIAPAQSRSGKRRADRGAGRERKRLRPRILRRVRQAPGHRPHHRAGAGLHAARHDDRVRRQPHRDARRLRRARLRHRHVGSRACAGDADADPEEIEEHARGGRRQAAARRHREGHHPRHHRRDRHRRRHRLCASNMPARRSARCRWKAA